MIGDEFDDIIAMFDDASGIVGVPHNETNKAIVAMLNEYVTDYETAAKWITGCVLIAVDKVGRSCAHIIDTLMMTHALPPHEVAIVAFEALNVVLSEFNTKDGRRDRRKKG